MDKPPIEYCFLWIDWWPMCMTKAEWSGWMQAIGAAVAILAAAGIATFQVTHARRIEEEKRIAGEIQRLNVMKALAVRCNSLSLEVINAIDDPRRENLEVVSPVFMRDVGATLLALPLFDIPGGMAALDVMTLGRVIVNLADVWDNMNAGVQERQAPPMPEELIEARSFASEIVEISGCALSDCKKEIASRGGRLS